VRLSRYEHAETDPSSVAHLSMRATFSHKGRREESAESIVPTAIIF
jgi:hypothetical protein